MSAQTRVPQNTNYLQPSKYLLVFDRMPTVQYFCQSVNLPGISLGKANIPTPLLQIYSPGQQLEFNSLDITFALDEKAQGFREVVNWFNSIASPEGLEVRKSLNNLQNTNKTKPSYFSDGILTLLSNLNNPLLRIHFYNTFPVSISDVNFDTKSSADDIITVNASFVIERYEFVDIS